MFKKLFINFSLKYYLDLF